MLSLVVDESGMQPLQDVNALLYNIQAGTEPAKLSPLGNFLFHLWE